MPEDDRIQQILDALQEIAAGNLDTRIEISPAHDEIDAIAHAVNVVGGELDYTTRGLARARMEAERANASKTEFLRNLSHELRTPLSVILGIAEVLSLPGIDEERRVDLCARIISNARAQVELLDDLLDLAQVESGKLTMQLRAHRVDELVHEVLESLEPAAHGKGLVLRPGALVENAHVLADRRRARQILVNVIGNAVKFTAHGEIVVTAQVRDHDLAIDITDTGIGMSAVQTARVFEPFVQADASISGRFGGSGLGLALSRRLAREMAGDLVILSTELGRGTTFRLTLPRWRTRELADVTEHGTTHARQRDLGAVTILLVDDVEDVRTPTALLLATFGAHVIEAGGGREAIELGQDPGLDLILMDVRMPDIDGLEATRQLRARGVTTPIVALTADVLVEDPHAITKAGCTTQLAKPIDVDRLVEVIRHLTQRA
ncbi:MAG: ATP-binding protein [Kofleriaceae bacterium]|nr:ATP-binding protein [Kofleriaceae bacterium]